MRKLIAILICLSLVLGLAPVSGRLPVARAAAVPSVALSMPSETMIGESLTFTATFSNPGTVGYGPFIDLVFPYNGSDGTHGTATPDGMSFVSATYLGTPVTATTLTFPDDDGAGAGTTGHVLHPYAVDSAGNPLWVYGTAGDKLVVLQLPFGSFTPGQPAVAVTVNASLSNLADLNAPLTVRARAGFQFGNTAVSDPATDPSIVSSASTDSSTWSVTASTMPTVLRLRKVYSGPEDETATGPNYVRRYTVTADIAAGQTITNLDLTDVLPNNLQFVSVDSVTPAGSATATPSTTTPGGTLTCRIPSVTGTTGTSDATMTFSFYVPRLDATSGSVLNPATGDDAQSPDDASAEGDWIPVDPRDLPSQHLISNATAVDHLLTDKSIAIQKSVAIVHDVGPAGLTPGDTLEYTLNFQVSDYFAFQNIRISSDVISDGQHLDAGFTPTYAVTENGALTAGSFDSADWTVTTHYSTAPVPVAPIDGTTVLTFDVSQALMRGGRSGQLLGGLVQPATANDGSTTGQIKFRTTVLDRYVDVFPSGNPSLDEGDSVSNAVTIAGDVLDNTTLSPTGFDETDGSAAEATIAEGALSKSVYAINGSTTLPNPLRMAPGDLVTYRIHYTLTTGDFELLHLTDYLPLPVFNATSFTGLKDTQGNLIPAAGTWQYGPANVRPAGAPDPSVTVAGGDNFIDFNFGTYDDPGNAGGTIDILFTVTVSGDPFADGLFLTNQVQAKDQNTAGKLATSGAIVQIQLTEPVLKITKGVVATDRGDAIFAPTPVGPVTFNAPGTVGVRWAGTITSAGLTTSPINSNLTGVDAGDKVTYAIVVENTGTGTNGAFDVQVKDVLPAGYTATDVSNLRVADGTGAVISTTNVGAGAGLFDLGIELTDPGATAVPTGALDPYDASSGGNIAVITYDLTLQSSLPASSVLTNTSSLLHYAGLEGGTNHLVAPLTDSSSVTAASPSLAKTLVGTDLTNGNNAAEQAVVGEIVNYRLTLTVPEGVTGAVSIVDTLDAGLAYVGPVIATNSNGAQVTLTGSTSPVVTGNGKTLTFDLGDITDANSDNNTPETITLDYRVVVLNVDGNQGGTQLNNSARMTWTGGSPITVSAPNTQVIQPSLILVKSVTPGSGDAGDEVTFSISVTNTNLGTDTDAYDVVVSDTVPAGLTYTPGSLMFTAGLPAAPAPVLDDTGVPTLTASWSTLPKNTKGTITFKATLSGGVMPGQSVQNTAGATWTTMPGTPSPSPRSTYNANSTERTLTTTSQASVTVNSITPAKSEVTTSEPSTVGSDVTIGEIVRYHLSVLLPEGSAPAFQIVDALPAGLTFLNDGSAKVAFVATGTGAGAGIVSSDAGLGTLPQVSGSTAAVTPTFALPSGNISPATTFVDGADPTFMLGDLTNYDRDADGEYVVLEFNAIVSNVAANITNRTLDNTFTTRINGAQSGAASNSVRVTVRQPALTTTKVVTHAPADAGDTATFAITVTNTGNATAFEVNILDILSQYLDLLSISDISYSTDDNVSNPVLANASVVASPGVDTVHITATSLAAAKSVFVTITAHVANDLPDGQITIPNTSTTTWTSLPGSGTPNPNGTGSVAGTAGGTTGERTGTGTSPNMYVSSSTATITLRKPIHLYKEIVSINGIPVGARPYRVQPGDHVRFRLRVENQGALPIYNVDFYDTLPAGWTVDTGTSQYARTNGTVPGSWTSTANPNGSPYATPPTAPSGTSNLQWHIRQTVDATDDAGQATGTALDTLYLEFVATVTSSAVSSASGAQNLNQADMAGTTDSAGTTQLSATVIDKQYASDWALVFRPELLITKSVYSINGSTANVTQAQAGDTIVYRVIVRNTSAGANATQLTVTDTLPSTMTYVAGSSSATWSGGGSSTAEPTGTTSKSWTWASSVVTPGQNLTLFYSVLVSSATALGRNTNSASASGHDTGTSTLTATAPDGSASASAQVDVYKPVLRLTKTASAAGVAVGTPVDFIIKVESLDSYASPRSISLTDLLPSGWTYSAGSTYIVKNNGVVPISWGASAANPSISGQTLTWSLAETVAATDDQGGFSGSAIDTLWLKLTAIPGPTAEGTTNVNTAQATFADASGTAMPPVSDSVTICVGSPRLEMTKVVDARSAGINQPRTFTLKVVNQNAVSANAVNIDDYLPLGWQIVPATASWVLNNGTAPTWPGTAIVPTVDGSRLTFATNQTIAGTDDGGLATGTATDTLWVQFQAQATGSALQGDNANTAVATGIDPGNHPVGSNMGMAVVTVNKPEIRITKSVSPSTQVVGQNVTYSVIVTNTGNDPYTGAVVTDSLPSSLAFVSSNPVSTQSGNTVTFGAVTIPANGSQTFTIVAHVVKNTLDGTVALNSASVMGHDTFGNTISAGPATSGLTISAPVLSITKAGLPNPVKAGSELTYTIAVTNSGSQAATSVVVTDLVPAGLTFVSADAGGSLAGGVVTWSGLSVPSAGSLTLHWTATVASPMADNTVIPNIATVDSSEAGPVTSPPAAVVVSSSPQLNICKAGSQDPVRAGNVFTYTIRFANNSTMDVTGAVVTEIYPTGVTFVSASPSPTLGDNTWLIGNLGAGSSGIITITVRVNADVTDGTTLTNVVSIASDQTQAVQAQAVTRVGTGAALQISKSDVKDPVAAGATATYTLSFANSGSTDATGVQLVDDYSGFAGLPVLGDGTADIALHSWSVTSGSVSFTMTQDVVNHTLTFVPTDGKIPGRATGTITVVFDIPANVIDGTTRTNVATLSSTETNPVSDSESTTISSSPALHITKTATASVQAGGLITYTIEYWNDGAANATGVVVTESYSSLVSFDSATVTPDAGTNNVWTIGLVANDGVHHSIVITCHAVAPIANGTVIPNTVTLDSDQTVPQTAAASTTVGSAPVLTIAKSVTGSPVQAGQNLVYTMTIGNSGNADATGAVVTDATPANTTFVSARFVAGTGSIASPAVGSTGTVTWTLGAPLSPGAQVVVELVVKTNTPLDNVLTITNTAAVNCTEDPTGVTGTASATITSAPVLHLVKDAPANVNAGETITYTLHVTNTGNMNAHGVIVTDATPIHTTFVSAQFVSGGTGDVAVPAVSGTGTVTWTLDPAQTVTVGGELVLELIVQAESPLPNGTVIPNAASVVSAEITTPVQGAASTTIGSAPVLTIVKSVTPEVFTPGGNLTYTITIGNSGNMIATGVTITDITPPNTTFVSASFVEGTGTMLQPPVGGVGQMTWTPTDGTLGIGAHVIVRLVVRAASPLPDGTIITNTGIGDSAETQRVTSTVTAVASGAPVLVFTKTAFPTVQVPGGMVTWALSVRNIGTASATNVVVTETYDPLFAYQFANPLPDAGMTNRWTIGSVAPGSMVNITIIGQLAASIPLTVPAQQVHNTAVLTCAELASLSASADVTVQASSFWDPANVTNRKVVDPAGNVVPGTRLTYTNIYGNTGNVAATGVLIADYLDPNLDEATLSIQNGGVYNAASRTITWTIPYVGALASGSVSFSVNVRSGFDGGTIYNRSSIGVPGSTPTLTNTVTTWVYPAPVTPPTPPTPPALLPAVTLAVTGVDGPVCLEKGLTLGITWSDGTAPFAWRVDYGDGSAEASGTASERRLTLTHVYGAVGAYPVTIHVTGAGSAEATYAVTVMVKQCTVAVTVYHQNFFIGYPNKPFLPERSISRAEVAGALSRALGLGWSTADPHYLDLKYTHWATGFIALMQDEGIMMGDTGGTFRPDAYITRAEAAAVFLRLLKIAPSTETAGSYPDVLATHWAAGVIAAMKSFGLIQGYPDGTFHPNDPIKRSEFAVLACRALGRGILPSNTLVATEKLVHWDDVPQTYWAYWAIMEVSTPHLVTNPMRLNQTIQLKHKTIPLYEEKDDSIVTFLRLGDTVTAIVPVDGLQASGADPVARSVQVRIINHERP